MGPYDNNFKKCNFEYVILSLQNSLSSQKKTYILQITVLDP
jgi:hypothetical protein